MEDSKDTRKVFISYSWTNREHEKWVLNLAEKLTADGVEVVFDKWDLKKGQDKYAFMEKIVTEENLDKVLIICDKGYCDSADRREKGVGTETQIITSELYTKVEQRKFIPIIAQKEEEKFDIYMPIYMKNLIGIDMSSEAVYEDGYEELLRDIYDKPRYQRPKRGKMPSFLNDESSITSKLSIINKRLNQHILEDRLNLINSDKEDFLEQFFEELNSFSLNTAELGDTPDETIFNKIDEMKVIRDEFLYFIESIIKSQRDNEVSEMIVEFFEKIYSYSEYKYDGSYNPVVCDHFKFIIWELFIWINTILFKYKKYGVIRDITKTKYYIDTKFGNNYNESAFESFYFYCESLERRNMRLSLRRISLQADIFKERSVYKGKTFLREIIETDIILSYIALANRKEWFPQSYIYFERFSSIKLLQKMERKAHFDNIKILFGVNNLDEFKDLVNSKKFNFPRGYSEAFTMVPLIKSHFNIDELAKY